MTTTAQTMPRRLVSPIDTRIASGAALAQVEAPLYPPDEWFTDEMADNAPPKLTVLASGQVYGVVAPAGRCILDGVEGCWTIPRPADGRGSAFDCPNDADYRLAHVGTTILASGAEIPTAMLAGAGGHHSYFGTNDPAKSEYADTNRAVARGRYVYSDKAGGQTFIGALVPTLDEVRIASIRCSAVSVDYRWIEDEGRQVLLGATLVNIGGLPSRYQRPIMAGASVLVDPALTYQENTMHPDHSPCPCGAVAHDGVTIHVADCGCDSPASDVRAAAAGDPMSDAIPTDPEVLQRLDGIQGLLDEVLNKLTDVHGAMLEQRTAGATANLPII